jgi:catechol 2,3-dioxygenase
MNTVLSKDSSQTTRISEMKSIFSIPTTTRLGHVHLTVANLDTQINFYQKVLGMQVHWREGAGVGLGAGGEDLLRLTEVKGALRPRRTTGLYHFALMYPSRKELARALARLFALRYPNAPTDHGMSKSIYLDDAEGNTIELYILTLGDARLAIENGQGVAYYTDGRMVLPHFM